MATVREKIAYLRGLMEGSDFYARDSHAEAIWSRLLEILEDLSDQVEALRQSQEETEEYLEAIDSDLGDVEEELYGGDDDDDVDDDVEFVEVECPNCHETVYFEREFLDDDDVEISCPECGQVLYSTDGTEAVLNERLPDNGRAGRSADREKTTESTTTP